MPPKAKNCLVILFLLAAATTAPGADATDKIFRARAETELARAQKLFQAETNAATAAPLARASFDCADLATNGTQRAAFAQAGIAACHLWLAREPKPAPAHYYLAMNLGKLAEAEAPSLAAYRLVHEVEREFKTAAELDVRYDFAGPARTLGELYFQAPGWPLSVGSRHKAREWFERAAALAPDYPENQLNLAEAHLKWRNRDEAEKTLQKIEALWPAARTNFTGAARERDWLDWNARRAAARGEFQKLFKAAP
jgi:tetratricopeptide (TPR) repeat protein